MSRHPNEPGQAPPPELLRLAEEGARNIQRAAGGQAAEADRHLRVALGAHYGTSLRRLAVLPMIAGGSLIAATSSGQLPSTWISAGIPMLIFGLLGVVFLEPRAGRSQVEREREWLGSRGFPLSGYLEALGQPPTPSALLLARVRFTGEVPPLDLVQGVLGRVDPAATVQPAGQGALLIRSGGISGSTGMRSGNVFIYRNHRLVPYVHRLVDEVLAPLHATYPLAAVELTRAA